MQISPRIPHAVVLDVSTFPLSQDFWSRSDRESRRPFAPRFIAACTYNTRSRRYSEFRGDDMNDLLETIKAADKIVTFNGLNFDFLVLEQHHGLDRGVGSRPSNVDLSRVVEERIGRVTTLDELVQLNLNERKVHAGEFEHDPVDRTDAIAACRSDVRQIYRLWMLFLADRLKFPSN